MTGNESFGKTAPEYKYFNFPICFLHLKYAHNYSDKELINKIMNWCTMNVAGKIKVSLETVASQVIYKFYKKPDDLLPELLNMLNKYVDELDLTYDEDYHGFRNQGNFEPDEEIEEMLNLFNEDNHFKTLCIKQYIQFQAMKTLSIVGGNIGIDMSNYLELERYKNDVESKYGKDATTSIRTDFLFDARDGKLPFNLLRLLIAVKSVIGKRNFTKSYRSVINNRMFGCKIESMLNELSCEEFSIDYKKLSTRYWFDKLIDNSMNRGLLLKIPAARGFYVATKFKTIDAFADVIMDRVEKYYKKKNQANEAGKNIKQLIKEMK